MVSLVGVALECVGLSGPEGVLLNDLVRTVCERQGVSFDDAVVRSMKDALQAAPPGLVEVRPDGRVVATDAMRDKTLGNSGAVHLPLKKITRTALQLIGSAGSDGIWQMDVASRLDMQPQALFHHVKRLKRLGLIVSAGGNHETSKLPTAGNSNRLWLTKLAPRSLSKNPKLQGWMATFQQRLLAHLAEAENNTSSHVGLVEILMPEASRPPLWSEGKYSSYKKRRFRRLREASIDMGLIEEVAGKLSPDEGGSQKVVRCLALRPQPEEKPGGDMDPNTEHSNLAPDGPSMVWELDPIHRVIELMRARGDDGVTNDDLGSLFGSRFERKGVIRLWREVEQLQPFEKVPTHSGKMFYYKYRVSDKSEGRELSRRGAMAITETVRKREQFIVARIRDEGQIISYREIGRLVALSENEGRVYVASRVIQKLVRRLQDRKLVKEMVFYPYKQPVHAVAPYDMLESNPACQDFSEQHKLSRSITIATVMAKKAELSEKMDQIVVGTETKEAGHWLARKKRMSSVIARSYGLYRGKMLRAKILHKWIWRLYMTTQCRTFRVEDVLESMTCEDFIRALGIYRDVGNLSDCVRSAMIKDLEPELRRIVSKSPRATNQTRSLLGLLEAISLIAWSRDYETWEISVNVRGPDLSSTTIALETMTDVDQHWKHLRDFSGSHRVVPDGRFFSGKRVTTPHWKRSWEAHDDAGIGCFSLSDQVRLEAALVDYLSSSDMSIKDLGFSEYDNMALEYNLPAVNVWKYCEHRKASEPTVEVPECAAKYGLPSVDSIADDTSIFGPAPKRTKFDGRRGKAKKKVRFQLRTVDQTPPSDPYIIDTGLDLRALLEEAMEENLLNNPTRPGKRHRLLWTSDLEQKLVAAVVEHKLGGGGSGDLTIWVSLSQSLGKSSNTLRHHFERMMKRSNFAIGLSRLIDECKNHCANSRVRMPKDFLRRVEKFLADPMAFTCYPGVQLPERIDEFDDWYLLSGNADIGQLCPHPRRSPGNILEACLYFGYRNLSRTPDLAENYFAQLKENYSLEEVLLRLEADRVISARGVSAGCSQFAGRCMLSKPTKPLLFPGSFLKEVSEWREKLLSSQGPMILCDQSKVVGPEVAAVISLLVRSELSLYQNAESELVLQPIGFTLSCDADPTPAFLEDEESQNSLVAFKDTDKVLEELRNILGDSEISMAKDVLKHVTKFGSGSPPTVAEEDVISSIAGNSVDISSSIGLLSGLNLVTLFVSRGKRFIGVSSFVEPCLVDGERAPNPFTDMHGNVDHEVADTFRPTIISCILAKPGITLAHMKEELAGDGHCVLAVDSIVESLEQAGDIEVLRELDGILLSDACLFALPLGY